MEWLPVVHGVGMYFRPFIGSGYRALYASGFAIGFFGVMPLSSSMAWSSSVPIPMQRVQAPAVDLVHRGEIAERDSLLSLAQSGLDLSLLRPASSQLWDDSISPVLLAPEQNCEGFEFRIETLVRSPNRLVVAQVERSDARFARASFSLDNRMVAMTAHLLRKLGYQVPQPKLCDRFTLNFTNERAKLSFLDTLSDRTLTTRDRWISSQTETQVVFHDVVLEPDQVQVLGVHWHVMPEEVLRGRRVLRSLIAPLSLLYIPESINLYSPELGRVLSEHLVLQHPSADSFAETSIDDLRWIGRKLLALSAEDWRSVVEESRWPAPIQRVLFEKLISRRNQLISLLSISAPVLGPPQLELNLECVPRTRENAANCVVWDGKVTKEFIPGFATRFSFGDPDSPLRGSEVARLLKIQVLSEAINFAVTNLSGILNRSESQVVTEHRQALVETAIGNANNNQVSQSSLAVFAGPMYGLNISASRNLVTGTYYGSDSKVQLVDTISITASLGFFVALDVAPVVVPGVSGNVMLTRSYIHVRPVQSVLEADRRNWLQLIVPRFMRQVASVLDETQTDSLQKFSEQLREGEVFTVVDSLSFRTRLGLSIPLFQLVNPVIGLVSTAGVYGQWDGAITGRVMLMKKKDDKLQVLHQRMRTSAFGIGFDFNFIVNIIHASRDWRRARGNTRAYELDLNVPVTEEVRYRRTIIMLRSLFKANNTELLEQELRPVRLDHELSGQLSQLRFLFWNRTGYEELHRMRVIPRVREDAPSDIQAQNPEQFARTLVSHRVISLRGSNYQDFVSGLISGVLPVVGGVFSSRAGPNPANSFMGQARWSSIGTEAEMTPGRPTRPMVTVEHFESGWIRSPRAIVNRIRAWEMDAVGSSGRRLFRPELLAQTSRLEMYEVRSTLLLYESAMNMILEQLQNPSGRLPGMLNLLRMVPEENISRKCMNLIGSKNSLETEEGRSAIISRNPGGFGNYLWNKCSPKWMQYLFHLGETIPDSVNLRVKSFTRIAQQLQRSVTNEELFRWLGPEKYFFQIRALGFRRGDENGDVEMASDSIGQLDADRKSGVFAEVMEATGVASFEVFARSLGVGL